VPRPRRLALLAVVALAAVLGVLLLTRDDGPPPRLVPGVGAAPGESDTVVDPLAWDPDRAAELTARAERGHAHPLYVFSPGGAVATAARVARFRPLIETVASEDGAGVDPDTLEAMVYLESAGRPDAAADADLEGAVGLTQIVAQTGRDLLGMRVDPRAARGLTRRLRRARRRGQAVRAARLALRRRTVDERFDPPKALRGAVRYLAFARERLGRDDLAIVSYHMGVGNLQDVLADYGAGEGDAPSYPQVYFDSSPLNHAAAWRRLSSFGDDSSTYLWRVGAARRIMRLWRSDLPALRRRATLMTAKNSAEEVLHPPGSTPAFAGPGALRAAYASGALRPLPAALLTRRGVRIDPQMGELAPRLRQPRRLYRGLRPAALAVLVYLGAGTRAISGQAPLRLTSTVRDRGYQQLLLARNPEATRAYSLHTTGYAFDVLRRYRSTRQARAFQFMLDRLRAHDLIAYVREPSAIHVTVSSRARELEPLLEP